MRRLSIALQHPPVRLAASWLGGLLAVIVFYWHLTTCARNGNQTLGWLSWIVDSLIALGRTVDHLFMAYGWHIVVAFVSLAITTVFMMKRGQERRSLVVAISASALGFASILSMAERHMVVAVGCALGAAILLLASRLNRGQLRETARKWPLMIPLAVGGVLRFWSLAEYPRGFAQHAVEHLKGSLIFYEGLVQILRSFDLSSADKLWDLLAEQWGPMSMIDGIGFVVFGVGWVQARLTQAVLGCLAIGVAFALGSSLDGRRFGFLFSFLLAVSPWHLAFSRYGDAEHVLPTVQALLAVLFVFRAARFGRTLDYILAGITVAMSWYVYATNQIVPFLAAGFLLYKLIASRGFLRRDGVKLAYMAAVFVLISLPHVSARGGDGLWLARTPIGLFNPFAITELHTTQEVGQQLYWNVQESWFFREGGGLGPVVQTLLIVGTVLCVAGLFVPRRRDSSVLLLLWLALSFLPAVLSQEVQFRRLLLTLVVALALASVAILRTLRLLEEGGMSRRTSGVILIGLCVLGSATSSFVYFEEVRIGECNLHIDHTEMADYVSKHIGEAYLYVFAPTDTDRWTVEDYISLFAYDRIRELGQQGVVESDLVSVVEMMALIPALQNLRSFEGKTELVASRHAMGGWDDPASLRSQMGRHNRIVRRQGELVIWKWNRTIGAPKNRRGARSPVGGG
jgi:4-amino-4-deoxy-L-arabinose transferase-like glycosyltransferase